MMTVTAIMKRRGNVENAEEFTVAKRSLGTGLTAAGVTSSWTWSTTLLSSVTVAYQYGVAGSFFYAACNSTQIMIFSNLAIVSRSSWHAYSFPLTLCDSGIKTQSSQRSNISGDHSCSLWQGCTPVFHVLQLGFKHLGRLVYIDWRRSCHQLAHRDEYICWALAAAVKCSCLHFAWRLACNHLDRLRKETHSIPCPGRQLIADTRYILRSS